MSLRLILILIINFAIYTLARKRSGDLPPNNNNNNENPNNRVINGFTPGRYDNPYVLQINSQSLRDNSSLFCTGILLSSSWALTAGHCAANARSVDVNLGMFSRTEGPAQRIFVPQDRIFIHPGYNETEIVNDLALLRLSPRANILKRSIRPIPFACPISGNFAGEEGRLCGWGITNDNATDITNTIQCVDMTIITNEECEMTWQTQLKDTNICTSTVDQRTGCHGDSGGPLVIFSGIFRRLKLVGVVSFGSNPCAGTSPDVFTRITSYTDWIRRIAGLFCSF